MDKAVEVTLAIPKMNSNKLSDGLYVMTTLTSIKHSERFMKTYNSEAEACMKNKGQTECGYWQALANGM